MSLPDSLLLNPPSENISVDMLLSASSFAKLLTSRIAHLPNGYILMDTLFGAIILGGLKGTLSEPLFNQLALLGHVPPSNGKESKNADPISRSSLSAFLMEHWDLIRWLRCFNIWMGREAQSIYIKLFTENII